MKFNQESVSKKRKQVNTNFMREFQRCINNYPLGNILSKFKNRSCGISVSLLNDRNQITDIEISQFSKVSDLIQSISKKFNVDLNCTKITIYFHNFELEPEKQLLYYNITNRSKVNYSVENLTEKFNIKQRCKENSKNSVDFFGCVPKNSICKKMLSDLKKGFKSNFSPQLAMDGTGGTYFLKNEYKKSCAVFKPADEEPFAPNNPKIHRANIASSGFKPGLKSGLGANREVAAYILDRSGFSGVPVTTMVKFRNCCYFNYNDKLLGNHKKHRKVKIGSLQQMVKTTECAADYGTKMFDVEEVHKVAILDLHIVNLDRNDGNILIKLDSETNKITFVPIDHGYCLPNCLAVEWYDWVWLGWEHVNKPFSQKSLDYINAIDIEKDVASIKSLGIEEEAVFVFRVVNTLLKKAAKAGLGLHQIAKIILRSDKDKPSKLETIILSTLYLTFNKMLRPPPPKAKNPTKKEIAATVNKPKVTSSKSVPCGNVHAVKFEVVSRDCWKNSREKDGKLLGGGRSENIGENFMFSKTVKSKSMRSRSHADLVRLEKMRSENSFMYAKELVFPKKIVWQQKSSLEVPESYAEKMWKSQYIEISCSKMFRMELEEMMDYAIFTYVLANRKAPVIT